MNEEIKNAVLSLVDTCVEAVQYAQRACVEKSFKQSNKIFLDLDEVVGKIQSTLDAYNQGDLYTTVILYCKNIRFSIRKILKGSCNEAYAKRIINMELYPFCREMKKILSFYLNILPYEIKWEAYRAERNLRFNEYADHIFLKQEKCKYNASIVLFAYNKLEYTKQAIESIYQYTDFERLKVELITVNNGSEDGTEAYLESLPHTKKINLKYNIIGNETPGYLVEGKYIVGFSNDVLATYRWLDKLMETMDLNPQIYMAVPTCNEDAISNGQGIKVPYKNKLTEIAHIQRFAKAYNLEHQRQWEERLYLMPFVAITRFSPFIQEIGCDRLYTQCEFVDDDWSTSLRRVGLKQILIKDTFLHHFGSITLREMQMNDSSLQNMREVYYKKWGVDAWDSRGVLSGVETILRTDLIKERPSLLCVEPRFGGDHLCIRNYLRNKGITPDKEVGIVLDQRYIEDARYVFGEIVTNKGFEEICKEEKRKFNLIYFGAFLHHIVSRDVTPFLEKVYEMLDNKGQIIFALKNYQSVDTIVNLLMMKSLGEYASTEFSGYNVSELFQKLSSHPFLHTFRIGHYENDGKNLEVMLNASQQLLNFSEKEKAKVRARLLTKYYVVIIDKE